MPELGGTSDREVPVSGDTRSQERRDEELADLWKDIDWELEKLVSIINQVESASVGITLTVHGGVITGLLCSAKEWFEEYGRLWREGGEIGEAFAQGARDTYERTYAKPDERDPEIPYHFVHLKNARFVAGNVLMPQSGRGFVWRGKLTDVSGFALGSLGPPSQ